MPVVLQGLNPRRKLNQSLPRAFGGKERMVIRSKLQFVLASTILFTFLVACNNTERLPAGKDALEKLQKKYDELVEDKLEDPVKWAADDLEKIGDWEYRVLNVAFTSPDDLEAKLNKLGNERWEVIWMERSAEGFLIVAKKPSVSYLSRVPLSQLGRLVTGDSESSK